LACAAGLAVAKYFSDHDILTNVRARGAQLTTGLEALAKKYPSVLGEVRGWGLLQGVVCVGEVAAGTLVQAAMDEGLLLVAAGPNVVRFVPPLIITEAELDEALTKFEAAVVKKTEE
jgi:acetylornithine/N-succinyldiaminopimelate aminotransferase